MLLICLAASPNLSWGQAEDVWLDPQNQDVLQQKWPGAEGKARRKLRSISEESKTSLSPERKRALKQGVLDVLNSGAQFVRDQSIQEENERRIAGDKLRIRIDASVAALGDKEPDFLGKDGGLGDILGAIKGDVVFGEETSRRNPNSSAALTWSAQQYSKHGEPRKAREQFSHALRLDPQNEEALSGRAMTNYNLGEHAKASEDALAALKINPENKNAFTIFKLSSGREPNSIDLKNVKAAFDAKDPQLNFSGPEAVKDPRHKDGAELPYVLRQKFGKMKDLPPVSFGAAKKEAPPNSGIPPLLPLGAGAVGGALIGGVLFRKRENKGTLIASAAGVGAALSLLIMAPTAPFKVIPAASPIPGFHAASQTNEILDEARVESQRSGEDVCLVLQRWKKAAQEAGETAKVQKIKQAQKFAGCANRRRREE